MTTLVVSEIFGPTVQGEGKSMGKHATFLRLGDCHLMCTWCDTPYTWAYTEAKARKHQDQTRFDRKNETREMTIFDIAAEIWSLWHDAKPLRSSTLVITGGEPLLQGKGVYELIHEFHQRQMIPSLFEIETSGTIEPPAELLNEFARGLYGLQWNVSPKLSHSGNSMQARYKPEILSLFARQDVCFKFVARDVQDFAEIDHIVNECGIHHKTVWVMPEGTTGDQLNETGRRIMPEILKRGWNYSDRLHVRIWRDARGH